MSEEKESIEYLKVRLYGNAGCKFIDVAQKDLRVLLKLIEKQQKEIKELTWKENEQKELLKYKTDRIDQQQKEINELQEKNKKYQGIEEGTTIIFKSKAKYVREDKIEKYYINKNKIREKIKELLGE